MRVKCALITFIFSKNNLVVKYISDFGMFDRHVCVLFQVVSSTKSGITFEDIVASRSIKGKTCQI